MQGKLYNTIILGAEPAGLDLAEKLTLQGHETALIAANLRYLKKHKLEGCDIFQKTGVLINFSHGLFIVSLEDNSIVCGKSLVLATGTRPIKSNLKNSNILYNPTDICGKHKNEQAVVFGADDFAVESALEFSKRFRYVYLCSDCFELACSKRLLKKLNETKNIVHLPNSAILSCKNDKTGKLVEVNLQTYSSIKTSTLLVSLGRIPDYIAIYKRFINQKPNGFFEVTSTYESTKVPGLYAIGGLLERWTKRDFEKLADILIQKFKEE